MNIFKKNQIIIYVIAIMLVAAAYLNFTTQEQPEAVQTSSIEENTTERENIGDAQLVNSNDIVAENSTTEQNTNNNSNIANQTSNNTANGTANNTNNNTVETNATNNNNTTSDDYFVKSKLERDTMYSQMLETYQKILDSTTALETQKQSASEEITKINHTKNSIMICENLITTKGFNNNIIFVNGDSISVIIESDELKQEEIAQIQNIIAREMNAEIENIHISNK